MSDNETNRNTRLAEAGSAPTAEVIRITDPATDRYFTVDQSSHLSKEIVQNATVMVVGAGALGNEVLKNLALLGIGRVFIVDFDVIEAANLSRSVLFRLSDTGRRKVDVAAEGLKALNPDVKVARFHGDITTELGLGVVRRMDVVIGCLDNREARLWVNRACWKVGKPWVDGAILEFDGVARVFVPGNGACYECTLTEADWKLLNVRYSCPQYARASIQLGKVPTTPTISSIVAAIQTQEALKILHDIPVSSGKAFIFNGLTNDSYLTEYNQKSDCSSHFALPEVLALPECSASVTTAQEILAAIRRISGDSAVVRLGHELVIGLTCRACSRKDDIPVAPLFRLTEEDAKCLSCGRVREAVMSHFLTGAERFLGHTLSQLGIPPLDILTVQNGSECWYFELTGDEKEVFRFV